MGTDDAEIILKVDVVNSTYHADDFFIKVSLVAVALSWAWV